MVVVPGFYRCESVSVLFGCVSVRHFSSKTPLTFKTRDKGITTTDLNLSHVQLIPGGLSDLYSYMVFIINPCNIDITYFSNLN